MELGAGTPIGPYRIDSLIARGGMGTVYRARRAADGAVVALKLLQADALRPERRARFEREAQLTARLAHPNVVRVHGTGVVGALHYLVMDLVEGEPLSQTCGHLAPQQAMRILADVARGIEHAHEKEVLHRDIKPSNVLVRRDDGRALITDFGIARAMDSGSSLTKTGAMVGTPFYMAPEQILGEPVTTATDVHGLGLLLYEALTGVSPFQRGELAGVCHAVTELVPPPPSTLRPGVPRSIDRLCAAALAKDPARRPTAAEFAAGLESALVEQDAPRRPRLRLTLALLVVAVCAGVGLLVASRARSTSPEDLPVTTAVVATRTNVAPKVAPEPRWLRSLQGDGNLEALRAAESDTRGDLAAALPQTTRDAALKAADGLARRWRSPTPRETVFPGPEQRAELRLAGERLVLIHTLRRRLDPRSALPDDLASTLRMLGIAGGLPKDSGAFAHGVVELLPDDLLAYTVYTSTLKLASDERVLRRGLVLAAAAEDWGAWRDIAGVLGDQLATIVVMRERDAARARAARAALDALVEEAVAHADDNAAAAWTLLKTVANLAYVERRYDDCLREWTRALPYFKAPWDGHSFRAKYACDCFAGSKDPAHAAVAFEDLEALLRFAEADPAACESVLVVVQKVAGLLVSLGRREEAFAALDRLLAVAAPRESAAVALHRVVLDARGRAERVPEDLTHLARCVDARRDKIEAVLTPADRVTLGGFQQALRDTLAAGSNPDLPTLASWLEGHPARRYLHFEFAP